MRPIIRVENVGKRYRLGARATSRATLRDALAGAVRAPFQPLQRGVGRASREIVWALKDVSFEVRPGEVVGIIGRNGAGKSTLLKVLSRITEPTTGRIELYGRVGSLLEVGTGFHAELTGRENIYLNGAILGMSKDEIKQKFDEIVAFSEVEKYLDTPVKHYSSGMTVRLAFAVAAHLEPEILIVDEVLAVGDVAFQRKCLSKMQDVGQQGRTVLFVSHNMSAVTRLCERAVLLSAGVVISDGPAHEVVGAYLSSNAGTTAVQEWPDASTAPGDEIVRLRSVRVCDQEGQTAVSIDIRRPVGIEMVYDVLEAGHVLVPNFHFFNEEGVCAFIVHDFGSKWRELPRPTGRFTSTTWIPGNFLAEGTLFVRAAVSTYLPMRVHFDEPDVVAFQVVDSAEGDSARGDYAGHLPGIVRPVMNWTTRFDSPA